MLDNFAKSGNFYPLENRVDGNLIKTTTDPFFSTIFFAQL